MEQTMTLQAQRELQGFLGTFPTSRYAPRAREMLKDAEQMLLDRELYVARYYEKRQNWRATAWRLDGAVTTYPALATTPDVVWRMARAYTRAEEPGDAAKAYAMYLERFPDGPKRRDAAKEALDGLRRDLENPPPAAPKPKPVVPAPSDEDDERLPEPPDSGLE
jgi:outer membrane protein assembly factor BamD